MEKLQIEKKFYPKVVSNSWNHKDIEEQTTQDIIEIICYKCSAATELIVSSDVKVFWKEEIVNWQESSHKDLAVKVR